MVPDKAQSVSMRDDASELFGRVDGVVHAPAPDDTLLALDRIRAYQAKKRASIAQRHPGVLLVADSGVF
jgi:hypothetical protein